MSTSHHLCISIRGMLHWTPKETRRNLKSITKNDGTRFRDVSEFREELLDELAKGRKVLPTTNPPCEGFSYETGCPGHEEAVKELPILFSAPMVRALLEGRKTQTRRLVKHPEYHGCLTGDCPHESQSECDKAIGDWAKEECPYGQLGDRLWVRETLRVCSDGIEYTADEHLGFDLAVCPDYAADLWDQYAHEEGPNLKPTKIPSIFMPRWASRITLEITDVRVQRLQEISEEDAVAEGIEPIEGGTHLWRNYSNRADESDWLASPVKSFESLWESINAKRVRVTKGDISYLSAPSENPHCWAANPWVWAITLEVRP